MKKIVFLSSILVLLSVLCSCEEDLPLYDSQQARLNFKYNYSHSDSLISYSFVYYGDIKQDTVWVTLNTMGFPADHDRQFELRQVPSPNGENAVPGKHYVSFDDPGYKSRYLVVPAHAVTIDVPIIMLRDASLKSTMVALRVMVKDNENFISGYANELFKEITFTDMLTKPDAWGAAMNWYFGEYGKVKHQFMIDVTGEKWDDDYIKSFINDYGYVTYLKSKLRTALDEENARRRAAGLGDLCEENGMLINWGQF